MHMTIIVFEQIFPKAESPVILLEKFINTGYSRLAFYVRISADQNYCTVDLNVTRVS